MHGALPHEAASVKSIQKTGIFDSVKNCHARDFTFKTTTTGLLDSMRHIRLTRGFKICYQTTGI